jgi:hypothetical protein
MRRAALLFCVVLASAGCKRAKPPGVLEPPPSRVQFLSRYQPGNALDFLVHDMQLDRTAVRYRRDLPDGRKSAIYFFEEGDMHVDAAHNADGVWVLSSVPFIELKSEPAAARLKRWDEGAETKQYEESEGRSTQ